MTQVVIPQGGSKILANLMNSDEILKQIDFPVGLGPVYTKFNGKEILIKNQRAVIREDLEEALSTVSDRYGLVTHAQALAPAIEALNQEDYKFSRVALHRSGSKLVVEATAPSRIIKVMGEDHYPRILLVNSYDGTNAVKLLVGLFRTICTNGMISGNPGDRSFYRAQHSGNAKGKVESWTEAISQTDWLTEYKARLEKLDKKVDEGYALEVLSKVFSTTSQIKPVSSRAEEAFRNALTGEGQNGTLTKWSVLNGITQALRDYELNSDESQLARRMLQANKSIMQAQHLLLTK